MVGTYRPVKLLGSTAIDDKLQDEVPETIEQPLDVPKRMENEVKTGGKK